MTVWLDDGPDYLEKLNACIGKSYGIVSKSKDEILEEEREATRERVRRQRRSDIRGGRQTGRMWP